MAGGQGGVDIAIGRARLRLEVQDHPPGRWSMAPEASTVDDLRYPGRRGPATYGGSFTNLILLRDIEWSPTRPGRAGRRFDLLGSPYQFGMYAELMGRSWPIKSSTCAARSCRRPLDVTQREC